MKVLELLAKGNTLNEFSEDKIKKELLSLLATLVTQNSSMFKDLLKTFKEVMEAVLKLSPVEGANVVLSARLSTYQRRQLTTAFCKLWGFTPLPSELAVSVFEKEVTTAFTTCELERGQMLLHKSSREEAAKLVYFARIKDIKSFIAHEVGEVLEEKFEPGDNCVQNLRSPKYGGRLRILIGGDKGGSTTKVTVVIGGAREPIVLGMFAATDSAENLLVFFGDWTVQLRRLITSGLRVVDPDIRELVTFPVDLLTHGDMSWQSAVMGHAGSAAKFPILYSEDTKSHLQKDHQHGEPHLPDREQCQAVWRTPDGMHANYLANKLANVTPHQMAKNSKKFMSIKGPSLIPIQDILHLIPARLHFTLKMSAAGVQILERGADVLDGTAEELELGKLAQALSADEEDPEGEADEDGVEESSPGAEGEEEGARVGGVLEEKAKAEAALGESAAVVKSQELVVKVITEKVDHYQNVVTRVKFNQDSEWEKVEEHAKTRSTIKRPLRRFRFCTHDTSLCLLTYHDHNVVWRECVGCNNSYHNICELWGLAEFGEEEHLDELCRDCRDPAESWQTYDEMLTFARAKLDEAKDELCIAEQHLGQARMEMTRKTGELVRLLGPRRRKLATMLEELGVVKTQYMGGTLVGAHCEKVLENHQQLSSVLEGLPELQATFNAFFGQYLIINRIMKARRWLTDSELDTLASGCPRLGELWPQLLPGATIPPKLHVITHVVPRVAAKWGTLGALDEERLEAVHGVHNRLERVLVGMRDKGKAFLLAMKRVKVQAAAVKRSGPLCKPQERKFRDPKGHSEKMEQKRKSRDEEKKKLGQH